MTSSTGGGTSINSLLGTLPPREQHMSPPFIARAPTPGAAAVGETSSAIASLGERELLALLANRSNNGSATSAAPVTDSSSQQQRDRDRLALLLLLQQQARANGDTARTIGSAGTESSLTRNLSG